MRVSSSRYEMDMTTGPIMGKMIRFSVPLMFSSILQLLYNAADMVVAGQFAGADALAAVGATGAITALLVNLFLGLSVGANVAVAQHYGAGRYEDVSHAVHTTVLLSLLGGIAIGLSGIVLARPLLVMLSTPADVLDQAELYMIICFAGMPANLVYNFCAAILRAVGDTKRPLYYLTISGAVNVALNLLFVIVFQMGVAGVAIATVASQLVSMVLVVLCLLRVDGPIRLQLRKLRLYRSEVKKILLVGLPAGLQSSMYSISNTLIQSSINSFGSAAIAGNIAASNVESFVSTPLAAFHQAAMSFTSQNYGAKKPERLGRIVRCGSILVLGMGISTGALAAIFGETLLGFYATDPAVIQWGLIRTLQMTPFCFLGSVGEIFNYSMRGMGKSVFPMIMSILTICVFRVFWILTVFAAYPTPSILYLSYPISWSLATCVHVVTYLFHKRKVVRRMRAELEQAA